MTLSTLATARFEAARRLPEESTRTGTGATHRLPEATVPTGADASRARTGQPAPAGAVTKRHKPLSQSGTNGAHAEGRAPHSPAPGAWHEA